MLELFWRTFYLILSYTMIILYILYFYISSSLVMFRWLGCSLPTAKMKENENKG